MLGPGYHIKSYRARFCGSYAITDHAREQAAKRGLSEEALVTILSQGSVDRGTEAWVFSMDRRALRHHPEARELKGWHVMVAEPSRDKDAGGADFVILTVFRNSSYRPRESRSNGKRQKWRLREWVVSCIYIDDNKTWGE